MAFTITSLGFTPRCVTPGTATTVRLTLRNDNASACSALVIRMSGSVRSVGVSEITGLDSVSLESVNLAGSGYTKESVSIPAGGSRDFEAVFTPRITGVTDALSEPDFTARAAVDNAAGTTGLSFIIGSDLSSGYETARYTWAQLSPQTFALLKESFAPRVLSASIRRVDRTTLLPHEEGEAAELDASVTSVTDAELPLILVCRREGSSEVVREIELTDGLEDGAFAGVLAERFENGAAWALELVYGDAYESDAFPLTLPRAFANMHLSAFAGGGVCFGGFSSASADEEAKLECYYPAYFYGGVVRGVNDYAEAEARVGTWIDGRDVWRRACMVDEAALPRGRHDLTLIDIGTDAQPLSMRASLKLDGAKVCVPGAAGLSLVVSGGCVVLRSELSAQATAEDICAAVEYLKEEDDA